MELASHALSVRHLGRGVASVAPLLAMAELTLEQQQQEEEEEGRGVDPSAGHTAMKKLRIVRLGFCTARQKLVLERWTNLKPLQHICDRAAI